MTIQARLPSAEASARGFAVVVLTYRCAMAELCDAQAAYRVDAWEVLESIAPDGDAEALFGCFFGFVRALLAGAGRPLQWRRTFCAHLCRDEWLAVAMIDAAQRADPESLLGFASELIGVEELGDALHATQALAAALARRGLYLRANERSPHPTLH